MHDPLRGGREKMHAGAFFVVLCCIWLGGFWLPLYMLKLEQRIRAYVNILHRY